MADFLGRVALFDSSDLTTVPGLRLLSTDPNKPPKRALSIMQQARRSARKLTSAFFAVKVITITIAIVQPSRDQLDQSLDTLWGLLTGKEKPLILSQSGTTRQYTATYADYNVQESSGGYEKLDLLFELSDSYGYDTTYTQILNLAGMASGLRTDTYIFTGSSDEQPLFAQVQIASVTGGTNASITIGNQNTGQQITVTRNWSQWDLLQIDSRNLTVQVNGSDVNFSGAFPTFPGKGTLGTISYQDTFASRSVNYLAYYYRRFI